MSDATEKKQRGRPKGSTSFIRVNLDDLRNAVGINASIVVSKKWLQEIGLTIDAPAPTVSIATVNDSKSEEKIEFSVTSFD